MKINIEWLSDQSDDCETCGVSWAEGAKVSFEDSEIADLEMIPSAHCFGGDHYNADEVFKAIIAHLGHEVIDL